MPAVHVRQARVTNSARGTYTKNGERIQKFEEKGNSRDIC